MSDFWMLFIFAIICILIAYGLGCQIGYKRGEADGKYRAIMQYIEMKAKLQSKGDKDVQV